MSLTNSPDAAGTPAATPSIVRGSNTGESFATPAVADPAAPAAPAAAAPAAPAPVAPGAGAPVRRVHTLDDAALNDRLVRAKRQGLIDTFGTTDTDAIKAKLAKADALEAEAEARKREQMSEVERLKHDLAVANQTAQRARAEVHTVRERQMVQEQQGVVERIASRHVASAYVQDAAFLFAKHLRDNVQPADLARYTDKDIAKWFQTFASRRPAFAASTQARTKVRAPVGSPAPAPRPNAPASALVAPAGGGGRTIRPGQPNSMSREEARAEARKNGFTW